MGIFEQEPQLEFVVWFDSALHEIVIVEKEHYTQALDTQLKKEHIQSVVIWGANRKEVQESYIENYETLIAPSSTHIVKSEASVPKLH